MRKFFLLLGAALVLFVGFTVAVTARYDSDATACAASAGSRHS